MAEVYYKEQADRVSKVSARAQSDIKNDLTQTGFGETLMEDIIKADSGKEAADKLYKSLKEGRQGQYVLDAQSRLQDLASQMETANAMPDGAAKDAEVDRINDEYGTL
jgi:hypothetical protein